MSWPISSCEICGQSSVNRLIPFVIRCSKCKAKYNVRLHWTADWLVSGVVQVIFLAGAIYSVVIQSLWPFGVGVALLLVQESLGRLELDKDDAITAHELLKRRIDDSRHG
ncbi:MAG: hypothetical protein ACR2QL_04325 [Woeseiaceae bacterium]